MRSIQIVTAFAVVASLSFSSSAVGQSCCVGNDSTGSFGFDLYCFLYGTKAECDDISGAAGAFGRNSAFAQFRSCREILEGGGSVGDGVYRILRAAA